MPHVFHTLVQGLPSDPGELPSLVQGDILYASAANVLSVLAKNTSATRYLSNTGTSNNPAWTQVDLTNGVSGYLPVANGGTGLGSLTSHGILLGDGTSSVATIVGTDGQIVVGQTSSFPLYKTMSGDATLAASGALTIAADAVTFAKMQNVSANSVPARAASSSGDLSEVALSASQLLGRGSTGDVAAISLGGTLSMSGTTLSGDVGGIIILEDQKTTGTAGGTFTSGAWRTRTLNTEVADTGGNCSLSANQFTLDAGTYEIEASAPAFFVFRHQIRLQNVTDGTTTLVGTSECTDNTVANDQSRSFIWGRFTIASSKAFEIQHQCQNTLATNGLGLAVGTGFTVANELYTQVWLRKVA